MRNISQSVIISLNKDIEKIILAYGGKLHQTTKDKTEYRICLIYGLLYVTLNNEPTAIYSIYTRFENTNLIQENKEKLKFVPNFHSGKQNFHYSINDIKNSRNDFIDYLENII